MSRTYYDLSALAAAAIANDCTVHLHQDDQGSNVFSVGNSNAGAREFQSVRDAMAYLNKSTDGYTAADCAEQAGHAIASNCLDVMLNSASQAESSYALQTALLDLQLLPHPKRAAGGFAVVMVNVIEIGLQHLPKVTA